MYPNIIYLSPVVLIITYTYIIIILIGIYTSPEKNTSVN